MSTTPRSGSPAQSQGSQQDARPNHSMIVEHSIHQEPMQDGGSKMQPRAALEKRAMNIQSSQSQQPDRVASPNTPGGALADFDWAEFEQRYLDALDEADGKEQQILEEFDQLVEYFAAWAAASSTHDDERAIKRLQTRSRHVQLSEQTLTQKKQHLSEVVKAFQSALALLSST